MDKIINRLENAEMCIVALWALIGDTFPPAYQEDVTRMMSDYFDSAGSLGGRHLTEFNKGDSKSLK